ncbi:hypothetical protein EUX98_g5404 [Antrodiella citrinella]|uniref:Major facilitator superfamily (MFS) profile domain-containing protein n=1 Tax=Antrodiella citrinella TaxID=2447956 RepID=A0A4V3XIE9_9APHY|nr:hypothetical protein EUX98_g5404 [Antrodiella citrinella]
MSFVDLTLPGVVHNHASTGIVTEDSECFGEDLGFEGQGTVTAFSSGRQTDASRRATGSTANVEVQPGDGEGADEVVSSELTVYEKFDDMSAVRIGIILFSLGLCSFLYAIVSNIAAGVHATGSLTWITTSYLLTTTVIQPITGRFSDVSGTKRLLLAEIWILVLGNIIAGTACRLPQLVAGRLISGVGAPLALHHNCLSQRGSYMNLINVVFIVADSMGPILGGILAKSGNWRWIFLLNAPIGPVVSLVLILVVHLKTPSRALNMRYTMKNLDTLGMFMLIANLTLLIVALNLGGDSYAWSSLTVIGLLVASCVSLAAFIYAESLATNLVIPLRLFVKME